MPSRYFRPLRGTSGKLAVVALSFTVDANGAVVSTTVEGAAAWVSKPAGTGLYDIHLGPDADHPERYYRLEACVPSIGAASAAGYQVEWQSEDVDGTDPKVRLQVVKGTAGGAMVGQFAVLNPAAADLVSIVADVLLADGAQIIAAQPDTPRKLQVRITDGDSSISAGTVTLDYDDQGGVNHSQVIALAGGTRTVESTYACAVLNSATVAALAGHGAGDNIGIGVSSELALPVPEGATGLSVTFERCDGARTAAGTIDATARTLDPTTAPNGTHDYEVWFEYAAPVDEVNPATARIDCVLVLRANE